MSDETVTVNKDDLRTVMVIAVQAVLNPDEHPEFVRLRAALSPEPCGHPSRLWRFPTGGTHEHPCQLIDPPCTPLFTCAKPRSHHAFDGRNDTCCLRCSKPAADPIHSGADHQAPDEVWQ